MTHAILNCKNLTLNSDNKIKSGQLSVELLHQKNDPKNVNRLKIINKNLVVEVLPSKGLSVGEAWYNKKAIFWEPIIEMPDPDLLELNSDEVAINGEPLTGFTFLKTFNGGVELYGLKNWGMPRKNKNGTLLPIHGETSNIPVNEVTVSIDEQEKTIEIKGEFFYNSFEGGLHKPWYLRGEKLVKVIRSIIIKQGTNPSIDIKDTFKNISNSPFFVDWGYHITFAPEKGARIIIPSKKAENRSGEKLPEDIESWVPAKNSKIRTEVGIIHKGLKEFTENELTINKVLIQRPNLGNLVVSFSPSPYMQSWMCNGGANSTEFTLAKTGKPLFRKNWDGMGIELGASALDHDKNTDPAVPVATPLQPKETVSNFISIKIIDKKLFAGLVENFGEYSE